MTLNTIKRPIGVCMIFLALTILGTIASLQLPISLMPNIDVPEITVRVSDDSRSARQMESAIVSVLRNQLTQVAHLDRMTSKTQDGSGTITLRFDYGTDTDMAFVETNEKIDRALVSLPKQLDRPRAMKASATDIPVCYLQIATKEKDPHEANDRFPVSDRFLELSDFCTQVVARRLEQIPEVAMIDHTGTSDAEILILPNEKKLESMNMSVETLKENIQKANVEIGNLVIRDGNYQFHVNYATSINKIEDLQNLWIKQNGQMFQLKEIAKVMTHPAKERGMVLSNDKRTISLAVIKQADARMEQMKESLSEVLVQMEKEYPNLTFELTRDQTLLLTYSIDNLRQSLYIGGLLAVLIMFFFLRDFKSPFLIAITVPVSLIISMLLFYILGLSLNLISLSGLILGVGMMIDNSIIVIDNITQRRLRGESLIPACANGASEVFRPMLSSVLTTCAVFVPLIFLSGLSGAMFYDQAMAISVGLSASLLVSVTILPVCYHLFYRNNKQEKKEDRKMVQKMSNWYERWMIRSLRHQRAMLLLVVLLLLGAGALFYTLPKSTLPAMERNETMVSLEWNEKVHLEHSKARIRKILNKITTPIEEDILYIGEQDFVMNQDMNGTSSTALLYLKAKDGKDLISLEKEIQSIVQKEHPQCTMQLKEAENFFDLLFKQDPYLVEARFSPRGIPEKVYLSKLTELWAELHKELNDESVSALSFQEQMMLSLEPMKLHLYHIQERNVANQLEVSLNNFNVMDIMNGEAITPVRVGSDAPELETLLSEVQIETDNGDLIQLASIAKLQKEKQLKTISADEGGEYYPLGLNPEPKQIQPIMTKLKQIVAGFSSIDLQFTGSFFKREEMIRELSMVFLISLLLLYLIMATQFESFLLPLIVLIEVPIDLFGVLLCLKLFGASINLMSMIGIVVMSGIIINDSILKIDTINRLYKEENYTLTRALLEGGKRRFKPIVMTSLTTILAMVPFLFGNGLGNDLQKPLALAVIGGMTIGTLVSLYVVPVLFYQMEKGKTALSKNNAEDRKDTDDTDNTNFYAPTNRDETVVYHTSND